MPKFIVKVPVTLLVCVEVTADSKKQAVKKASEKIDALTPLYTAAVYDGPEDRPDTVDAGGEGWFENVDQMMIFEGPGVTVHDSSIKSKRAKSKK